MSIRTRQTHRRTQQLSKQVYQSGQSNLYKALPNLLNQSILTRKKEKLNLKRRSKQQPLKESSQKTQTQNSSSQLNQPLKSQQQVNILDNNLLSFNDQQQDLVKQSFELDKLIKKPNYIKLQSNFIVKGYSGHASVIFKKPILEGAYYFEVKIIAKNINKGKMISQPSIRIGLCPSDYPHTIPLGGKGSIGYRSTDGMIVSNKKGQKFGPSFTQGDVIGIQVNIAPPHKYPKPEAKNQGSSLTYYKNGEKVGLYTDLKQIFYCVGISLYNYADIELRIHSEHLERLSQGFQPYIQCMNHQIPYKDLKNSQIFND